MKQKSTLISLLIVALLVLPGLAWWGSTQAAMSPSSSRQPAPSGEPSPAARTLPASAINWDRPPPCQNRPLDLPGWRTDLADPDQSSGFQAYITQLRPYTPLFRELSLAELKTRLAASDSAGPDALRQRALTVLWLNIISGRLNQATEITPAGGGSPFTLGRLIEELEQARPDSAEFERLLALVQAANNGQQLSRHVCARLIYRQGMVVRQILWAQEGFIEQDYPLPAEVPFGVTTFSPDYSRLVIETPRSDSGGGPLYLFDLETKMLINLNKQVGLPSYTGVSSLKVGGWHYDNRHLLLVNEADEVTIWLDLEDNDYTPLDLGVDTHHHTPAREIRLGPDGSGFVFVTFSEDGQHTHLGWYSLAEHKPTLMTTLPLTRGQLTAFSFAPASSQAAYMVGRGQRRHGRSQELRLVDLTADSTRLLLSARLGHTQPVWSPTGQQLALTRTGFTAPERAGPSHAPKPGNIWTVTVPTGQTRQLTFINAIKQTPVWSPGGQYLAFVTVAGQIGMVAADQPGLMWRVETDPVHPQFTTIALIP